MITSMSIFLQEKPHLHSQFSVLFPRPQQKKKHNVIVRHQYTSQSLDYLVLNMNSLILWANKT